MLPLSKRKAGGGWHPSMLMSVLMQEGIFKALVIFPKLLIPAVPKIKLLSFNMRWITQL